MTGENRSREIDRRSADPGVVVSDQGIEIRRRGTPVGPKAGGEDCVYLLVECSASMAGEKLEQARRGSLAFARDALDKGYATGLIQFHQAATLLCQPQREGATLDRCLSNLTTGGLTNMAEAIALGHRQLRQRSGSRAMVVVTDGVANGPGDPRASLRAADAAKNDGIDIIAIGTDDADQEFLKRIASRVELGVKVSRKQLEETIASSARLLPSGGHTRTED